MLSLSHGLISFSIRSSEAQPTYLGENPRTSPELFELPAANVLFPLAWAVSVEKAETETGCKKEVRL